MDFGLPAGAASPGGLGGTLPNSPAAPTPVGIAPQTWSPQMLQAAQMTGGSGQGQMPVAQAPHPLPYQPPQQPRMGIQPLPFNQGPGYGTTPPGTTIGGYGPSGPSLLSNGLPSQSPDYSQSSQNQLLARMLADGV